MGDVLLAQVRTFCNKNEYSFAQVSHTTWSDWLIFKNDSYPSMLIVPSDVQKSVLKKACQNNDIGDIAVYISTYKRIRQYLMGNQKQNTEPYFVELPGVGNWARKPTIDHDELPPPIGMTGIVMTTPVHLLDDRVQCLNLDKPERERTYLVADSSKPYRKFDGQSRKHCSKCPFSEGCVMCTFP